MFCLWTPTRPQLTAATGDGQHWVMVVEQHQVLGSLGTGSTGLLSRSPAAREKPLDFTSASLLQRPLELILRKVLGTPG